MRNRVDVRDLYSLQVNSDDFVLVGAGPSLMPALLDLQHLVATGAQVLLADSVARGLTGKVRWGIPHPIVFSVEQRRHPYLYGLPPEWHIAMYWQSNLHNLPLHRSAWLFSFAGENAPWLQLVSPGTVLGAALAYALYCLKQSDGGRLYLLGIDFSYLDYQIYTPAVYPHLPLPSRWHTYESAELVRTYSKTGGFLPLHGHLLRTSAELTTTRANFARLIDSAKFPLQVYNYSPVPLPTPAVTQITPTGLQ